MLHLSMTVDEDAAGSVERHLDGIDGVRRIVTSRQQGRESYVLTADIESSSADAIVETLSKLEVSSQDYILSRMEVVAPVRSDQRSMERASAFAWIEVLGSARANSRPLGRFLVMMVAAGVIASIGVTEANPILIVGAMAVSPDLLPICATCVGLSSGRFHLAGRSSATLIAGLGLAMLTPSW